MNTEDGVDVAGIVREAVQDYLRTDHAHLEPAYQEELEAERRRREILERRVNELVEENRKARLNEQ